jgi:2-methylcitrate dehydratase PrpD
MTTLPPVTDALARFVTETDFSTISGQALDNAKLHILDTLGVALAAITTPVA